MKNIFINLIGLLTILVILAFSACQKEKMEGEIIYDTESIKSIYNKSSDTIEIENQQLILETSMFDLKHTCLRAGRQGDD